MLGFAVRLGAACIEVKTCGQTNAPHFDLGQMPGNCPARHDYRGPFDPGASISSASTQTATRCIRPIRGGENA